MKKNYFLLAAAAVAFAACSNNESDNQVQNPDNAIRLSTSAAPQTRAGNVAATLQDEQFANNTEIKVQVVDLNATEGDRVNYALATYTADGSGGLTTTATDQYYPATGSDVKVYAYHPANASTTFTVQSDQTSDPNYIASDLMWAEKDPLEKNTTNTLTFEHKLSKIIVKLVLPTNSGFDASELANATIAIGTSTANEGVKNQVTFDPATGAISDETGDQVITVTNAAGTSEHAAVIVPQNMSGKKICVTIAGTTKEYPIVSTTFDAGKKYTYTIKVKKTGLDVTSSIGNWEAPGGYADPNPTLTY